VAFARLLVFACEAIEDAETIRRDASELRDLLLRIYRTEVLDPSWRRRHDEKTAAGGQQDA